MTSLRTRVVNVALRRGIKRNCENAFGRGIREAAEKLGRGSRESARKPRRTGAGDERSMRVVCPSGKDAQRTLLYPHGGGCCPMCRPYRVLRAAARTRSAPACCCRITGSRPNTRSLQDRTIASKRTGGFLASGIDPSRIVVAGDSAGGNLALVTAIRIRDAGLPAPGCAVMLSAATDLTGGSASLRYNRDRDPLLVPSAPAFCWTNTRTRTRADQPWISPVYADSQDRSAPLHAGSTELIVDDSIRAAERARAAGVAVELEIWPNLPHVFQMFDWLPEAEAGLADIARFVGKHASVAGAATLSSPLLAQARAEAQCDRGSVADSESLPPATAA
jgi:acetyl esterase/lipase